MWRGAVSFGMVAIPVRMYLATESKSVSFRMLCPSCHNPIKNKRYCPVEEIDVSWGDTVRGYEVSKDEYVILDDHDLDNLPLPTQQTIEILEFVDDAEIDDGVYVKQAYYLEPEAVGAKPYRLLRAALDTTGRVAIGRIALRDREHLVRLSIHGDEGILLTTLHWPDEIRPDQELKLPGEDVSVAKGELDMAVMLVENLAAHFDPARHTDRYREALLQVVEEKMGEREAVTIPTDTEPPKVMDLMAALRASVEAARKRGTGDADSPAAVEVEEAAEPAAAAGGGSRGRSRSSTATAARTTRAKPSNAETPRRRKAS